MVASIIAHNNQHTDAAMHMYDPPSILQSLTCVLFSGKPESMSVHTLEANIKNLDTSHMHIIMKPSPVITTVALESLMQSDDQLCIVTNKI